MPQIRQFCLRRVQYVFNSLHGLYGMSESLSRYKKA